MTSPDLKKVFDCIAADTITALTRHMIAIPTPSFEEGDCADFLAAHMKKIGLDVKMQIVPHPTISGKTTRQAIGVLRGTGGGKSIMFNAHMDTVPIMSGWTCDPFKGMLEDGWIWGLGAQDDKGGMAAVLVGIEALQRAGVKLAGDIVMCPVAAHKGGGHGTRAMLKQGVRADYCVNIEHSANTISNVIVGSIRVKIRTTSPGVFFRYTPEVRQTYFNSIEQMAVIMSRLGPSLTTVPEGSWLRYRPHSELADFPMFRYDGIHKDHYGRECELLLQLRTVPGMTLEHMREDLERVLAASKKDHPAMNYELSIPANGPNDPSYREPSEVANDDPLVVALANGYRLATDQEPRIGSGERIGNVGDGNVLHAQGIPSVQFGPGDIKLYPEWPAPNERAHISELITTARTCMFAAMEICQAPAVR